MNTTHEHSILVRDYLYVKPERVGSDQSAACYSSVLNKIIVSLLPQHTSTVKAPAA